MTTHEVLTSLLWLVAAGYVLYLAWFLARTIRKRRMRRITGTADS